MYGCDCDGVQREQVDGGGAEGAAIRAVLTTVERIAGHRPPTCPWRAMSDPLVRDVLAVSWSVEDGNLGATLGPDPDAQLIQALGVYTRAKRATVNEDERLEAEERKRKALAMNAARGRHG